MTTHAQLVRWGNSLAVRLPKSVVEAARMKEGEELSITVTNGTVEIEKAEAALTLADLVSQITPENRYREVSAGKEVGAESVKW